MKSVNHFHFNNINMNDSGNGGIIRTVYDNTSKCRHLELRINPSIREVKRRLIRAEH